MKKLFLFLVLFVSALQAAYVPPAGNVANSTDNTRAVNVATARAYIDNVFAQRAFSGYIVSDGATANRAQIQTPGARGNLAGAPAASWVGWIDVPTAATQITVASIQSVSTTTANNLGQSILILLDGGTLWIEQRGATNTDARSWRWPAWRTTYSGQRVWLEIRLTRGTGNPVVRTNGIDVSANFSLLTSGTPPEWLDTSLTATNYLTGYNWPFGPAPVGSWLHGHLTDAESETWRITGTPPLWVIAGGHATTSLLVDAARNGTFSAAGTDWGSFGSASVALNTGTQKLDVTVVGVGGPRLGQSGGPYNTALGGRGAVIRVTISNVSGQTVNVGNSAGGGVFQTFATGLGNGTHYITLQGLLTNITASPQVAFFMNGAGSFTIDDFEIFAAGALSMPGVQPVLVLDDWTLIGDNQAILLGMRPVTDKRDWKIRSTLNWAGTHEAKSLFSSPVVNHMVLLTDVITKATAGSSGSGLRVGTTGDNARYVNLNTYTTAKKVHALNTRFPGSITNSADTNLLLDPDDANYTGSITITVRGEMLPIP